VPRRQFRCLTRLKRSRAVRVCAPSNGGASPSRRPHRGPLRSWPCLNLSNLWGGKPMFTSMGRPATCSCARPLVRSFSRRLMLCLMSDSRHHCVSVMPSLLERNCRLPAGSEEDLCPSAFIHIRDGIVAPPRVAIGGSTDASTPVVCDDTRSNCYGGRPSDGSGPAKEPAFDDRSGHS
jgi:hypothetical protein